MTQPLEPKESYGQILKSTSIIGGSSVIVILLRIIQAKVTAVLLGPAGVGLIGIYGSVTGLISQISGMGIVNSGVRQIAEARGSSDKIKIERTIYTLRRTAIFLGIIGMLVLLIFRDPICQITFGNTDHAGALGVLSLIIFITSVSGGQTALIQGMRRVGDLARLRIFGALFGVLFSIPLVYFFGERGIVPYLVMVSAMGILTSWWYARKILVSQIRVPLRDMISEAQALLRLGLAFMSSGLMNMGAMYLIRVIVVRKLGLDAVGLLQASTAISTVYVGFILSAMSADFYPRLTSVANDNSVCNRIVNEQAEVSLLLAIPGILATLTFAPYVIQIFYSSKFTPAMDILRWSILGILLRVASWPMAFVLLAKGKGEIYVFTEGLFSLVYLGLVILLIHFFELQGVGMAIFGSYVFYWILLFSVIKKISGFSFSTANLRLYALIVPSAALVFLSIYFLPGIWATATGSMITIAVGFYCLRVLSKVVGADKMRKVFSRFKSIIHL